MSDDGGIADRPGRVGHQGETPRDAGSHADASFEIDPDNPVVRLCAEGMRIEGVDGGRRAATLFLEAWNRASDDYERCIAAHYLARHQSDPNDTLAWNRTALDLATASTDLRMRAFLPSLALNLAHAYEVLGKLSEAEKHYRIADLSARGMDADGYGNFVRDGIARGIERVRAASSGGPAEASADAPTGAPADAPAGAWTNPN